MKKLLHLLGVCLIINIANGQSSSCTTPSGGRGNCIVIQKCAPLAELLSKSQRTPQEIETLKKSACGFEGSKPKVCCPLPCFTPYNEQGKCVNIYSCPHVAAMLKPPIQPNNLQFVQSSRCQGVDPYSVCCGSTSVPEQSAISCAAMTSSYPPDSRTYCCGRDSSSGNKIVGGTEANIDQYPWLAPIEYVQNKAIKLLCAGSLISSRYVLTAAHCLVGSVLNSGTPKNVRLGEYDTSGENDCIPADGGNFDCADPVIVIAIEKTIPHLQYSPQTRRNDIGLIRLQRNAPFTDFIRPVCLPSMDLTVSPPPNFKLWAAGWGAVNATVLKSFVKLHVELPFVSLTDCQPAYTKRKAALWKGQVCAGGQLDRDSCKGDSGGPLMYERNTVYDLIGVVSYGPTPCGMENTPGVYTKVFEYIDWIRSNIEP